MSSVPKPESTTRRRVGLAAGLRPDEMQQVRAVGDVDAAVARFDAGRNEQTVGEDGGLVGLAVALGVFEDDDFVVGLLARLDLRIRLAARDPEPAGGVEVHLNRLGQQRIGGEEIDLEAVGELERFASSSGSGSGTEALL